ncbi:sulfite exporter TauE/SafE family protein [Thalassotalea montiporae]
MDPVLDISMWVIICAVGFIAGFIDAIAGGGGMLTVPTLLASGLPPHVALGTNKLASSFGTLTASFTFYRKKLFNPSFWRYALTFTAIGAVGGTLVVSHISTEWLERGLPILIMATAIYTLIAKNVCNDQMGLPKSSKQVQRKQMCQGTLLGFYDGVAGPGTGAFWMASSSALYKMNLLFSSGLSRSCNFVSNICSLATFVYLGHVNVLLGISMGLFLMLGAWVGAHSAIRFGSRFIRPVFIFVVCIISLNLAWQAWFNG